VTWTAPDGRVFEREQSMVDVTSARGRPDDHWRFTDKAGHAHFYGPEHSLPTLKAITYKWCSEDGDEYESVRHYECVLCGEKVTPGRVYGERQVIAGIASFYIDGVNVAGDVFQAEVAKYQ
jgi:hypothetical protein